MTKLHSRPRLLAELRRRKVFRVAVVYAATAFVVLQAADLWTAIAELDTVADDRYGHVAVHMGADAIGQGRFREAEAVIAATASRRQARRQREQLRTRLALARGQWSEARDHFVTLRSLPDPLSVDRLVAEQLFFAPFETPLGDLSEPRRRLLAWSDGPVTAARLSGDWTETLRPAARLYMLGLIASRMEEPVAARTYADSLERLARELPAEATLIDGLARVVRADLAVRSGDPRSALRELEGVSMEIPPSRLMPWTSGLWHAAHIRVRAYMAMDDPENAYRWLRHFVAGWRGTPVADWYGTYHRDMASVLDALGRHEEAALHHARFVAAWGVADPELQPQVAAASRRLQGLAGRR